jgi:hypothetical protein
MSKYRQIYMGAVKALLFGLGTTSAYSFSVGGVAGSGSPSPFSGNLGDDHAAWPSSVEAVRCVKCKHPQP